MKTMIRLGLAASMALMLICSGFALITYASTAQQGSQQNRSVAQMQRSIRPATWSTSTVTLDEIDPGKPSLSVGTPVKNVVFATKERTVADSATSTTDATAAGTNDNEQQDTLPDNGDPLYDTRDPGVDRAMAAAEGAAQLAANGFGEKPGLSVGTPVDNIVFASAHPKAGSERAALQQAAAANADEIDVWYGTSQSFGQIGNPQMQINLLGTIITPTGSISATFVLNGGDAQRLGLGPDKRRLAETNDFNVEIPVANLLTGTNTIMVTATDHLSTSVSQAITVDYTPGNVWPETYVADWSAGPLQSVAQVVDGSWSTVGGLLRPLVLSYDRLVAIGDIKWMDYEITVPVTIHAIDEDGFRRPSNGAGIGLVTRWQGHYQQVDEQPTTGWQNFGAIGWFRWSKNDAGEIIAGEQLLAYEGREIGTNPDKVPAFEVPYIMKMSVQSSPNPERDSYYRFKVWRANEPEPFHWDMESFGRRGEPLTGSMLLIAHHVDASFGNVTIRPLRAITPTITTATDGNGVILVTPEKESYTYGEPIEVIATGNSGFAFNEWHGDIEGSENPLTLLMTENISLTATFVVPEPAAITATTQGNGHVVVSPTKNSYNFDESVTLTAVPDEGSVFTEWGGSFSGNQNPITVKIRDDLNVVANFAPGAATPFSDDFRSCKLGAGWTTSDPKNDSTITLNGEQVQISVPAESNHNLFENQNFAPRVLQSVPNSDFIVEVKFESKVTERFQLQGIIAEQDADNFMRMEFFSDGVDTHAYAAFMLNGEMTVNKNKIITVPTDGDLYMRVGRAGNTWTQDYSFDGQTWVNNASFDHTIAIARVGFYGGNADPTNGDPDTSPAFTTIVDYFFNTASPIVPEDGAALAPQIAIVPADAGTVTLNPEKATYGCDEAITLTATPAEGATFVGWSGAATGSTTPLTGFTLRQGSAVTATFQREGETTVNIYLPVVLR